MNRQAEARTNSPVLPPLRLALLLVAIFISSVAVAPPGAASTGVPPAQPVLRRGALEFAVENPTSLAFGPDRRLYVANQPQDQLQGAITALTLDPATQAVVAVEQIAAGLDDVIGIAFDQTAAPDAPVTVYASRRDQAEIDGFQSKISRFTAPAWSMQDVITGLPTSRPGFNHLTNGLAFDDAGQLFIAQGSATDGGLPPSDWPETPLSAAILIADIDAPGFDGGVTYDPDAPPSGDAVDKVSGDVAVYAPGTRNPYDLLFHSNGRLYATDNGPSGDASRSCVPEGGPSSPTDELNLIEEGNYYGHPNLNRGRTDARQCVYHAPEEGSGADFTGPIALLPAHCSCDGIAEYEATGPMQGDLLVAQWSTGRIARFVLAGEGLSVLSQSDLESDEGEAFSFGNALDVTVGPDGTIFVAEWGAGRISFLAPDSDRDGCADSREQGPSPALGGGRDPTNVWDFFDTPDSANERDNLVSAADIARIVQRFGATGDKDVDPLSPPPPAPGYHPAFDRTPSGEAPNGRAQGPDGTVSAQDIAIIVTQFGHTCATA